MNYYEQLYIINSSLDRKEIEDVKADVEKFIISEGGDIYSRSDWGRTRLAYEIEKQRYGNYVLLKFAAKPEFIRMLREKLELMDAVLSSLTIVLEEEPRRLEEEIKNEVETETVE